MPCTDSGTALRRAGGTGRIGGVSRTDHGCGDFPENETFAGECTDCRRGRTAGMGGRTTERIIESTEKIAEILEGMPLLQAQETYQKYWKAAKSYEHMVETSGLIYNDSVENYNSMLHRIPDRIAAGICGFHRKKLIEIM